jgi:hypothetical protein
MRDSTLELLKVLKKRSGSDLLNLWEDLHQISRNDFLAAIEKLSPARKVAKRPKKGELAASYKSEEALIAFELKEACGLTGKRGVEKLRALLIAEGFIESKLPPTSSNIQEWIRAVTAVIPSGTVRELARTAK